MANVFRSFCFVACLITGIYGCIIFYHFRNAKRMLWFALLCLVMAVNVNFTVSFYPHRLFDAGQSAGINANIFLCSYALTPLCVCLYTHFYGDRKLSAKSMAFSYSCFVLSVLSLIVPFNFLPYLFLIIVGFTLVSYAGAFDIAMKSIKNGERYFIFQAAAYVLIFLVTVIGLVISFVCPKLMSPRVFCTPFFLLLHAFMMTTQYRTSILKTKKLSASLADTIERITHSDNALMCTQMKADFLYNTLDLISRKCDEDPYEAEDLTVSLSKYLRHTLNFKQLKGIVPLSNEIELTKAFIAIEKAKNPKIKFEYRFPDPLPDFHVPPLSIQPLVENAIYHAFNEDQPNPKITITIIPYRDYYHIDVSDNGMGMDEQKVEDLTTTLSDSARIGVYNIHTRLIELFRKGLVIQSAPGVGTSISFVVPPDAIAYLKAKEMEDQE